MFLNFSLKTTEWAFHKNITITPDGLFNYHSQFLRKIDFFEIRLKC